MSQSNSGMGTKARDRILILKSLRRVRGGPMAHLMASITVLFAASIAAQADGGGPSFNCSRASLPDEVAICQSPQLSELDRISSVAFNYLKSALGRRSALLHVSRLITFSHIVENRLILPHPVVDPLIDQAMLSDQPANEAPISSSPHAIWL